MIGPKRLQQLRERSRGFHDHPSKDDLKYAPLMRLVWDKDFARGWYSCQQPTSENAGRDKTSTF